jgi:agmatine deiminase
VTATLKSRGYAMPAEWVRHAATWIAWPHEVRDWPGRFAPIPWAYAELVRLIVRHERARVLVNHAAHERKARAVLGKAGVDLSLVDFYRIPTDRVWTRDSGAILVTNNRGGRIATHWRFNGWAKYPNHKRDDAVAGRIASALDLPEHRVMVKGREVVLEGGAIDVDGAGALLATEECLLSDVQARNPGLGRRGIEKALMDNLGVGRIIWLGRGLAGDDTHGHVDDVARFVGPGRVVLCREPNEADENHAPLRENKERLEGEGLEVIDLPMPAPLFFSGERLPASYANFYLTNGSVIVPTFNDPQDRLALGVLAECFPGREVVGFHAVDFVWGLGTVHCATQQEPAG